jgi:hypothetical protein
MRESPADSKVPAKRPAFWLNLGSKAEVNERFREVPDEGFCWREGKGAT